MDEDVERGEQIVMKECPKRRKQARRQDGVADPEQPTSEEPGGRTEALGLEGVKGSSGRKLPRKLHHGIADESGSNERDRERERQSRAGGGNGRGRIQN